MINFVRIAALAAIIFGIPSLLYANEHYAVQAGNLSDKARAQKLLGRLFAVGYDCKSEKQGEQYKVICGNFQSLDEVKALRQKLHTKGYTDAFAVRVSTVGKSQRISDNQDPGNDTTSSLAQNENADANRDPDTVEYYSVQVGSLSDEDRANKLVSRLRGRSLECAAVPVGFRFSVICGHLATASDARAIREKLRSMGYADAFVVHVQNGGAIKDISEGIDPEDRLTGALADVEVMAESQEYYSVQIGSLGDRGRAEKLVSKISSRDIKCVPIGVEGKFKVLCGSFDSADNARELKQVLVSKGYADAFTVRVRGVGGPRDDIININVNLNRLKPVETTPFEPLLIQPNPWPDILGRHGGHFHPFMSVSTIFTDNLYSSNESRRAPEKDQVTVSSLGFWLSYPSVKKPITQIATIGHVPGGFRGMDIYPHRERNRIAFISYRAVNRSFADHGYEDGVSHYVRGHLGYETSRGHTFTLDDSYEVSRSFVGNALEGTGFVNSPGDYNTNRLALSGKLSISEKLAMTLQHVSFALSYKATSKSIWNRDDTVDSVNLYVDTFPKTQFIFGYYVKEINYELTTGNNRKETGYSLGLGWDMTGKTNGKIKIGKSTTEFEGAAKESDKFTIYAGSVDYNASPKARFTLSLSNNRSESDNIGSQYFIHNAIGLSAKFVLSAKVRAGVGVSRALNTYYSVGSTGQDVLDREDSRLYVNIMGSYILSRNVAFEFGATHASRTSSVDIYDFKTNGLYTGIGVSF